MLYTVLMCGYNKLVCFVALKNGALHLGPDLLMERDSVWTVYICI